MNTTKKYTDTMAEAYVEALLWAGLDWSTEDETGNPRPLDENYGADDIAPEAFASIVADCETFYEQCAADLANIDAAQAGHDFYLTRNHHGAGFWDRGLGDAGDRLTKAAHVYGESGEYIADDGRIYV